MGYSSLRLCRMALVIVSHIESALVDRSKTLICECCSIQLEDEIISIVNDQADSFYMYWSRLVVHLIIPSSALLSGVTSPYRLRGTYSIIASLTRMFHGKRKQHMDAYAPRNHCLSSSHAKSIASPSSVLGTSILSARPRCARRTVASSHSVREREGKDKSKLDHTLRHCASNRTTTSGVDATSSRNVRTSSAASSSKSVVVRIGITRWQ